MRCRVGHRRALLLLVTGPPPRPLPAAWYEDPDEDGLPSAVEEATGGDPQTNECAERAGCASAGGPVGAPSRVERSNTLLVLDSSGSMAGPAGGGQSKLEAATEALGRYVRGPPDSVELGFEVYGHKGSNNAAGKAESCREAEVLQPLGKGASRDIADTLRRFRPTGSRRSPQPWRRPRGRSPAGATRIESSW